MTTIRTRKNWPLEGRVIATGRPVAFSLAMWCWVYTDTPGKASVEQVRGQIRLRRPIEGVSR